jgi:diaminopimelate decarboxylase
MTTPDRRTPWWTRDGLEAREGRLVFAGRDVEALARAHGTPLYLYDPGRAEANARRFEAALERAGVRHRLLYAIKANRHPAFLSRLRATGFVGIDACSPREVSLALESGWKPEDISFTGTNLSERDLDAILPHPLVLNLDSLSGVRRVAARGPRRIGLRVNPGVGTGYNAKLTYAGEKPTKFGLYPERLEEAVSEAGRLGLEVEGLHFHVGSGWLRDGLPVFEEALRRVVDLARRVPRLRYVNIGGGVGLPLQESDRAVDLDAYCAAVARHLGPLAVTVFCEPGDYLVKDAALLLVEVVTIEEKGGVLFVGVDCGFNAFSLPAFYHLHQEVVLCRAADEVPALTATIAGHINEAGDLFAEDCRVPELREGDVLALLNTGGYAAAMASHHCARPPAREMAVGDETSRNSNVP